MTARFKLFNSLTAALGFSMWLIIAMLSVGLCFAEEIVTAPSELAISSMATDGANLLLTASVPPGLENVTLDTRSGLDAPWESVEQLRKNRRPGGELVFTYLQSTEGFAGSSGFVLNPLSFKTLKRQQTPSVQPAQVVSAELQYVATASLASPSFERRRSVPLPRERWTTPGKILITPQRELFWDHVSHGPTRPLNRSRSTTQNGTPSERTT